LRLIDVFLYEQQESDKKWQKNYCQILVAPYNAASLTREQFARSAPGFRRLASIIKIDEKVLKKVVDTKA